MELLAPAGSFDMLKAAIQGGADAVYLGGKKFGARSFADNFNPDEMRSAIVYAHDKGVKVYVTVNTLIKDQELDDAHDFIAHLHEIEADAVIIQDLGLLNVISDIEIRKHASTQMGIHTSAGLRWAKENGISRVILARELTMDEIRSLAADSPVELEVFVHGALCYCISGQCLFSSMVGSRSGNRGTCAQPCRKRYRMGKREGYLLSTKDLNCLDLLDELSDVGIASVKIEGRMRGPAYANIISSAYARGIGNRSDSDDGIDDPMLQEELETVFNRGMGSGYLLGVDKVVNSEYADNRGKYLGEAIVRDGTISIDSLGIRPGDGIVLYRDDRKTGGMRVTDIGDLSLPFKVDDGRYDIYRNSSSFLRDYSPPEGGSSFKAPPIRRKGIGKRAVNKRGRRHAELSFYISSMKSLESVIDHADRVYFEWNRHIGEAIAFCEDRGVECVTILPRFSTEEETSPSTALLVNNVDQVQAFQGRDLYGSYHLNMMNSRFPAHLFQMTISPELSLNETSILAMNWQGRLEQMVFGRMELMVTRDPEMDDGTLIDEKGYRFPVYKDRFGLSHILNSADLSLLEKMEELEMIGIDSFGIDLRRRPAELSSLVAEVYSSRDLNRRRELKKACGQLTYGHYSRGV